MKDFLEYVAEDILRKYGTQLADITVVFPNKRASLFLNDHLARLAGKPLWSPAYVTISELFRKMTEVQVADPIKLVCDLHKSFCDKTGSTETLDKFYGWGQLLLADFDDIDKNMADADRVFANIRDIHELDDVSYLTDDQRAMLQQFFSNFSDDHNSELKERFLRLWQHMADIYHDFNKRLDRQGLAYEGALYRKAVEQGAHLQGQYLFIGFNLLQKVEQELFKELKKEGRAHFYWDFDHYYTHDNEAGLYISRNMELFPNELDSSNSDIYDNFAKTKHISFISAPTEDIQARYVAQWLATNAPGNDHPRSCDGRRTAVVMCNEALLPTVIHSMPDDVDTVNITTGYPLAQTLIASFIQMYINMHLGNHSPRLMKIIGRHPYAQYADIDSAKEGPLVGSLLKLVQDIGTKAEIDDPLFQESVFRAYTLLNRLNELISSGDLSVDDTTLKRLIQQVTQQTTIPFHGEPAEGIQILGVLETRNIDFDHVLLLSCNEGYMPKGLNDASFIPHSIRHAYELTTIDHKVAIYAHYFMRILQRCKDVTILYNSSTEDGKRGEMSRFMLQMMVESGHSIERHVLQTGITVTHRKAHAIEKTERVMEVMKGITAMSPTAISRYMRCPMQYYYRYVADIKEPDVPTDEQELDNRIFGNIFHEAADIIYKQLPAEIERPILAHLLSSKIEIERAVDEAFNREMAHAPKNGLHYINREVIIHYLRQLITIDMGLAPFTILGLEHDVMQRMEIPETGHSISIGGRIDRLDRMRDNSIRVVDYKTGGSKLKALANVDAIFEAKNIHEHADYYLQTLLYADIVAQQYDSSQHISPALLFIQHAKKEDYDPTLYFGKEPIRDIHTVAERFRELLTEKIKEIFSADIPFKPTNDAKTCRNCPYARLCRM